MIYPVLICGPDVLKRICGTDYYINTNSNTLYPLAVMREAAHAGLFKYAPVHYGHYGDRPLLGIVTRAFWSTGARGVIGLIEPQSESVSKLLDKHLPVSGYYHNAEFFPPLGEFKVVKRIGEVYSVDLVNESFLGGKALSLREAEIYLRYS